MTYRVGVSKFDITPPLSWIEAGRIYLWGYGFRTKPADSIRDRLWVRALAVEDESGARIVLVSLDSCAVDQAFTTAVRSRLFVSRNLPHRCLAINLTHTHSAPVAVSIPTWNPGADAPDPEYLEFLEQKVVLAAEAALDSAQPAELIMNRSETWIGHNRHQARLSAPTSPGAWDRTLDVLKAVDLQGQLIAVAFFHGCHAVFLKGQSISADYPGVARDEIESAVGGTALFFQGFAGTVNPLGKDMIATGKRLGQEVLSLLANPGKSLSGPISTNLMHLQLPFQPVAPEVFQQASSQEADSNLRRWANAMLAQGKEIPTSLPVLLQAIRIGIPPNGWLLAASAHEVVAEYADPLRAILPEIPTTLIGYTNFCLSYIPTRQIIEEPGHRPFPFSSNYEGTNSFTWYGQPAPLAPQVDELFIQANTSLLKKVMEA
jgi:hypothetical protein